MLVYHGNLPEVVEQVRTYAKDAEDALRSIFRDMYPVLEARASELLVPATFSEELITDARSDPETDSYCIMEEENDSGFFCITGPEDTSRISVQPDGMVTYSSSGPLKTYPIIAVTRKGIENTKRRLGEKLAEVAPFCVYFHEFLHLSTYCLQPVPMMVGIRVITYHLRDIGFEGEWAVRDLAIAMRRAEDRKMFKSLSILQELSVTEEINTECLFAELMERMGNRDAWDAVMRNVYGNPDISRKAAEARKKLRRNETDYIINWDRHATSSFRFVRNFYRSIRDAIEVERLPITEIV